MNTTRRVMNPNQETSVSTGIPFWDMMLSFGKASQQALAGFAPEAQRPDTGARSDRGTTRRSQDSVEVIPVGEETFHVGTHTVQGETVRLRRIVVETPVEQQVSLRTETVVVERRKPVNAAASNADVLTEKSVEMSDSFQVVDTWKSVQVREEVVLRTQVTERSETVRDTVRRGEVIVEQTKRPIAAAPQDRQAEPAHLAADLAKAAERFETDAAKQEKTLATLHETLDAEMVGAKTEPKPPAFQPQPQPQPQPPKAAAEHNDKGANTRKG